MHNAVDIRQTATMKQLQEEVMFLKGQNEAVFKILSHLTEVNGGSLVIPHNFGELVLGSCFTFDRNEAGDYLLGTKRDEDNEPIATSE
jgi:hypothetical protein